MNAISLLKDDEKDAVVKVLEEKIRQYREALAKPDAEGESADYIRKGRWEYTRKLETLVAALTKIESLVTEGAGK